MMCAKFGQNQRTRNSLVDETVERYRLNHAIVVQAARQAIVSGMMCLQAACKQAANKLLANSSHLR